MKRNITLACLLLLLITGCEKALLGPGPENTATGNFNLLWKTLDENYAQFDARHINWDSLYTVYSKQITGETTEAELWDLSAGLIAHLDDGHVCLINKKWNKAAQSSSILRTRTADDFSPELVNSAYLGYHHTVGEGHITYGFVRNTSLGYIYISSFMASGTGDGTAWAYDIGKAIAALSGCSALIVDVRNNPGGLIATENIIGSAFTDHAITFFYSRCKTGPGHQDFGEPRPVTISPRSGIVPWTKQMVMLTNRFTASGGEYMTQLFKNLPNSTQIGDTTLGAFGEITNMAQLPNGWTFCYPCTLTTTPDGNCPEGKGILPDVLTENTKADIDAGNDKVMEYAIEYLLR
ncbi:MAG: S41 family peptidase [Lentimicrobium sp.]